MADEQIRFTTEFDDSGALSAMEKLIESVKEGQEGFDDLGEAQNETFQDLGRNLDKTNKQAADFTKRTEESRKESTRLRDTLKGAAREINIFGVNVGSAVDALKAKQATLRGVVSGIGGANKALKAFRVALLATGVGAIVVALGSLVALLTRTQKGIDAVSRVTAALGAAFAVIIDRAAKLGEAIVALFQRDFSRAAELGREAVSGLTAEIQKETTAAVELERASQSLRDSQRALNVEFANSRARIEELRLESEDETKSIRDRQGALEEAIRLEKELGTQRLELAEENVRIIKERNALGNSLSADLDAEAQAEIELAQIRGEISQRQKEDFTRLQGLRREEVARLAEIRARTEELADVLADAGAKLGGPAEVARRQYELAIREIQRLKAEARELGVAFDFTALEQLAGEELKRGLDAARGTLEALPTLTQDFTERAVKPLTEELARFGEEAALNVVRGLETAQAAAQPILEEIRDDIQRTFNINDAQLSAIVGSFQQVGSALTDVFTTSTEAAIKSQDILIDALERQVSATQSALERELDLREQGYANNVELYEKQLTEQLEAQEAAEQKRLELEKKAARQRLVINSAEQISNYILAITKLTAAEAGKGIVAIPIIAAGVTLIASIVARARAISKQFAEIPGFREGTPYVDGPGSKTSDSISARLSRGERVLTADQNQQVGGRSMTNEELVRLFQVGRTFDRQFPGLDPLRLPVVPLHRPGLDVAALAKLLRGNQRELAQMQHGLNMDAMKGAYEAAAEKTADKMIAYWKSRPVEWIDDDGSTIFEKQVGNQITRRRIKRQKP